MTQPQGYVLTRDLPPIPAKRYFTIGEVSQLCDVRSYVLRYWESEFTQLTPMKRRGNRRYYQLHEVMLVREIRELLYEKGYTIVGARRQLEQKMVSDAAKFELAPSDSGAQVQESILDISAPNPPIHNAVEQSAHDADLSSLDDTESRSKFIPVADIMVAELAAEASATMQVEPAQELTREGLSVDSSEPVQDLDDQVSSDSSGSNFVSVVDNNIPNALYEGAPSSLAQSDEATEVTAASDGIDVRASRNERDELNHERSVPLDYLQVHIEHEHSGSESIDTQYGEVDRKLCDVELNEDLVESTVASPDAVQAIGGGLSGAHPTFEVSEGASLHRSFFGENAQEFAQTSVHNDPQNIALVRSMALQQPAVNSSEIGLSLESEQSLVEAAAHAAHIAAEKAAIALQAAEALANERSLQLKRIQEHAHVQAKEIEHLEIERQVRAERIRQAVVQLHEIRLSLDFEG